MQPASKKAPSASSKRKDLMKKQTRARITRAFRELQQTCTQVDSNFAQGVSRMNRVGILNNAIAIITKLGQQRHILGRMCGSDFPSIPDGDCDNKSVSNPSPASGDLPLARHEVVAQITVPFGPSSAAQSSGVGSSIPIGPLESKVQCQFSFPSMPSVYNNFNSAQPPFHTANVNVTTNFNTNNNSAFAADSAFDHLSAATAGAESFPPFSFGKSSMPSVPFTTMQQHLQFPEQSAMFSMPNTSPHRNNISDPSGSGSDPFASPPSTASASAFPSSAPSFGLPKEFLNQYMQQLHARDSAYPSQLQLLHPEFRASLNAQVNFGGSLFPIGANANDGRTRVDYE